MIIYEYDENRVYTGKSLEIGPRDSIKKHQTHIAPPSTEGYHIFAGQGWITRDSYPTPAAQELSRETRLSKLSFRNRFTLEEKVALEEARASNAMLRVFLDDISSADFIDLEDEAVITGVTFLETDGLIAAGRSKEILQ